MARYKPVDRSAKFLPVVLHEQIEPGRYEFTLDYLVDRELDRSELDAKFALREAQTIVEAHLQEIQDAWHRHFGT